MLDRKDLKNISDMMDKKFDDFAQIVQNGFFEVEGRLDRIESELAGLN